MRRQSVPGKISRHDQDGVPARSHGWNSGTQPGQEQRGLGGRVQEQRGLGGRVHRVHVPDDEAVVVLPPDRRQPAPAHSLALPHSYTNLGSMRLASTLVHGIDTSSKRESRPIALTLTWGSRNRQNDLTWHPCYISTG